jgi:hypothetical protein
MKQEKEDFLFESWNMLRLSKNISESYFFVLKLLIYFIQCSHMMQSWSHGCIYMPSTKVKPTKQAEGSSRTRILPPHLLHQFLHPLSVEYAPQRYP